MLFFIIIIFLNLELHSSHLGLVGSFSANQNFVGNLPTAFRVQDTQVFERPWIWQTSASSKVSFCQVWPQAGAARPLTLGQMHLQGARGLFSFGLRNDESPHPAQWSTLLDKSGLYRTNLWTSSKRGMDRHGTQMEVGAFLQQGIDVG